MSERCKNCKHIIDPQWSWCTDPECIKERIHKGDEDEKPRNKKEK